MRIKRSFNEYFHETTFEFACKSHRIYDKKVTEESSLKNWSIKYYLAEFWWRNEKIKIVTCISFRVKKQKMEKFIHVNKG